MNVAEAMIKHIIRTVLDKCPQEMQFFNSFVDKGLLERLEHVANSDFGRVTYTEAVEILKNGKDVSAMEVEFAPKFTKKFNDDNCAALGITVPDDYVAIG